MILFIQYLKTLIKYSKFKFDLKNMIFVISEYFHRTPIHISQNTSVQQNIVWEALV